MKKHIIDIEKSREVYNSYSDNIKVKECYNNVYHVFEMNIDKFRDGKWKIAYGYAEVMAGLYCRHCFILDENGAVIDPTIFAQEEPRAESEYFVTAVFDDVDEYLDAIENNDYMPALYKHFIAYDIKAQAWAKEHGMIFVR